MISFEQWYLSNKNYYHVKHEGDEYKMIEEAKRAYNSMISFTGEPKKSSSKKTNKKINQDSQ